jgi:hypothetical protein
MIPNSFHFLWNEGVWSELYTLCLKSCRLKSGAERIVVYCHTAGSGPAWDAAHEIPGVEWVCSAFPAPGLVSNSKIIRDHHGLNILYKHGGFLADLNFIFLKSFDEFRHAPVTIGLSCKAKKKLSGDLIGAEPGSAFIKDLIDTYKDVNPATEENWYKASANDSWMLALQHEVSILPRPTLFPWCSSNKNFVKGRPVLMKKSAAFRIWHDLDVNTLRKTCIASVIDEIESGHTSANVSVKPGMLFTFD